MFSNEDTKLLWEQACDLGRELRKGDAALDWWARAAVRQGTTKPLVYLAEYERGASYKRRFRLEWSKEGDFLDFHGEAGQKVFSLAVAPIEEMVETFVKALKLRSRFDGIPSLVALRGGAERVVLV